MINMLLITKAGEPKRFAHMFSKLIGLIVRYWGVKMVG